MVITRTLVLLAASSLVAQEPASPQPVRAKPLEGDARYVEIIDVPLPEDVILEAGGIVCRDDDLFVCTRRGEVWLIEDAYGEAPKASLWAEGLQEPLGLLDHEGWLYCGQRGEGGGR
ncbi:MAG: auracyanin family protein, partial [Planctomycetota bacterium]|nr:auracyanin family protein [Planctomycetota bacterium]